ncbi:quinol:cytochrome C oxidoreductase [Niastella koreensis]|uniref:Quinol:cytochrome c oxidoreductase monoheme cytochrome subunit n=2 Tax=Niastella koreensis TaxID=354356 RepID=G8TF76_NIAKG|nr:c-type cytochrome [Niastella koreensis]AEW02696.1 quinol:cytochrome c oxidoreductase monoheme cytochrome subunit [Niastella koreensis GR20-10]OQP55044.1 quinol:cytochrome C oxidoreductase [Niastella koreensis]
MKKLSIVSVLVLAVVAWSCNEDVRRTPGHVYMPDMAYSRAYETYAPIDTLAKQGIHYNRMPVAGTIKRGELLPFPLAKDKTGDTTNYVAATHITNPLPALDAVKLKEAERLYLVNCGICHGAALDGNGPLYKGGDGPFSAAPANLASGAKYVSMPEGQMFYSVTYGKGQMGSYASQLSTTQRWMVIHYIKSKQGGGKQAETAPVADSTAAAKPAAAGAAKKPAADTTAKKK